MITGFQSGVDTPLAVEQRRQLFLGARSVTGLQCDSCYRLDILGPSATEGYLDCVTVRVSLGLVRFHVSAPWRIRLPAVLDDTGKRTRPDRCEPIDAAGAENGPPLITEFCEGPEADFLPINGGQGASEYVFVDSLIGPESRRTIAIGEVLRAAEPATSTAGHHGIHQVMRLRTPMETAVMDVLMHRTVFNTSGEPRPVLYSDLFGERSAATYRETDRMPISVGFRTFDDGDTVPSPTGMDRSLFERLLEIAFSRTDWSIDEFRHQRLEVPYPPVPSSLVYEAALD